MHRNARSAPAGTAAPRRSSRAIRAPWVVAALVLLLSSSWVGYELHSGHDVHDFIFLDKSFVRQSHVSSAIKIDPHYHYLSSGGYDGQFSYFIAVDPIYARYYLDTVEKGAAGADYRYTRIVYPMAARLLALGQVALIPYTLILINLLALAGGTLALALWLRRKALSPWFALVYGLYPGLFVSLQRDLTEALAYAFVALGVLLFDGVGRRRLLWAGLAFALASLTRETTAIFPLIYGLSLWFGSHETERPRSQWRQMALLLGTSLAPVVLYKLLLWAWLGAIGHTGGLYPDPIPFGGLFFYWPWKADQVEELVAVVLPAMLCGVVALRALRHREWHVEVWLLLANVLLFVVFLNHKSYVEYFASGRIAAGVVLAALLCLPRFDRVTDRRWWLWGSVLLWFSIGPALLQFYRRGIAVGDVALDLGLVLFLWLLTARTGALLDQQAREQAPAVR